MFWFDFADGRSKQEWIKWGKEVKKEVKGEEK